jgi:hypothetical protein
MPMTASTLPLLAGAAVVIQNAVMTTMAARDLEITGALVCNGDGRASSCSLTRSALKTLE